MTNKKQYYDFPPDVPTAKFFEEISAVYAGRGGGKTTKAKEILLEHKPPCVVWIDPTISEKPNLDALSDGIKARKRFIKFGVNHPDMAIAALLACFRLSTKQDRVFVVCDEAAEYLKAPDPLLRRIFNTSRHEGLGILMISQRPSGIHPDFRSQAVLNYIGPLGVSDLGVAREILGSELAKTRKDAKVGDFIKQG